DIHPALGGGGCREIEGEVAIEDRGHIHAARPGSGKNEFLLLSKPGDENTEFESGHVVEWGHRKNLFVERRPGFYTRARNESLTNEPALTSVFVVADLCVRPVLGDDIASPLQSCG